MQGVLSQSEPPSPLMARALGAAAVASSRGRSGPAWRRYRATVFARETVNGVATCWLCKQPVDMAQPNRVGRVINGQAPTLEHKVPLEHGGRLLDLANGAVAHRSCNSAQGARIRNGKHNGQQTQQRGPINSRQW